MYEQGPLTPLLCQLIFPRKKKHLQTVHLLGLVLVWRTEWKIQPFKKGVEGKRSFQDGIMGIHLREERKKFKERNDKKKMK